MSIAPKESKPWGQTLAVAAALSLTFFGVKACNDDKAQSKQETTEALTKTIQPQLASMGQLAICLSKKGGVSFKHDTPNTVILSANAKRKNELPDNFAIKMGTLSVNGMPDAGDVRSAHVATKNWQELTLAAPGTSKNPSEEDYYANVEFWNRGEHYSTSKTDYPKPLSYQNMLDAILGTAPEDQEAMINHASLAVNKNNSQRFEDAMRRASGSHVSCK